MKVEVKDDCLTADDVRARNRAVRDRLRNNRLLAGRPATAVAPASEVTATVPAPPEMSPDLENCLCAKCLAKIESWMSPPELLHPSVQQIKEAVSRVSGVSCIDIESARRTKRNLQPRQLVMALARRLTRRSLPEIGMKLGGRDHTTILHGARKYEQLLDVVASRIGEDAALGAWVDETWKEIKGGWAPSERPRPTQQVAA